jgi:hypothetical protein
MNAPAPPGATMVEPWIVYCHECRWNKEASSKAHGWDLADLHTMATAHKNVVLYPPKA